MSIFSRGSKKRKNFVEDKMQKTNSNTGTNYTDKEANEKYMTKKRQWADTIIKELKKYCALLCDPKEIWEQKSNSTYGNHLFWDYLCDITHRINKIMHSSRYKNVTHGGSSSKFLPLAQNELGQLMTRDFSTYTDPENFKSSMQSCGKGLSKLTHPIVSTALVKVGKKGERIVDYVDELARLMLNKTVQENAAILRNLDQTEEWPANDAKYTYEEVKTKYVTLKCLNI